MKIIKIVKLNLFFCQLKLFSHNESKKAKKSCLKLQVSICLFNSKLYLKNLIFEILEKNLIFDVKTNADSLTKKFKFFKNYLHVFYAHNFLAFLLPIKNA
jgi:hypothetical protein